MIKKSLTVDFNRRPEQPLIIARKTINLKKPEPTRIFGIKFSEPKIKVTYHRLWIETASCPNTVEIGNPAELFQLKSAVRTAPGFNGFTIDGVYYPYEVLFFPVLILDYKDHINDTITIEAHLKSQFKPDSEVFTLETFQLELNFVKASPEPSFKLYVEPGFRTGFEHNKKSKVLLGHLELQTLATVSYSETMDCAVNVKFDGRNRTDLVFFGSSIQQSNPIKGLEGGGLREEGNELLPDTRFKRENANRIDIKNLLPGNLVKIPLFVDLTRLENPHLSSEHSTTVYLDLKLGGHETARSLSQPFYLKQDSRRTELKLQLDEYGEAIPLTNTEQRPLETRMQWVEGQSGEIGCFSLILGNKAENGEGIVCIRDLQLLFQLKDGSSSEIITASGQGLESLFKISGRAVSSLPSSMDFPSKVGSFINLAVAFRHDQIEAIPNDIATLVCSLHFKYQELKKRPEHLDSLDWSVEGVKTHETRLIFSIERNLGAHWLAIDFGTSATVAAFDEDIDNLEPINLQTSLKELVSGDLYNAENIQEFDTPFLASNILLRNMGALHSSQYDNDVIYLSAPFNHVARDNNLMVPYLKSMIGLEKVPNLDGWLDDFKYKEKPEDLDEDAYSFEEKPLYTKQVLTNTYRILLRDFIKPNLVKRKLDGQLNKIVISVPNTFTPRHTDFIRDLIAEEFPYLRREYITFVSESDSIAYFYLSKWNLINRARDKNLLSGFRPGAEYTLVYDMGAGTLDLTYLRIETDGQGQKTVRILGRLGKSTAGNYLDYTIARYIHDQFDSICVYPVFRKASGIGKEAQVELKRFIREKVKPNLDSDIVYNLNEELQKFAFTEKAELSSRELRDSAPVRDFYYHNTSYLMENFFTLFNTIDGRVYKKGSLPLDTVIFSGRSIQIGTLKLAMKAELETWCNNPNLYFADLGDPNLGLNSGTLKSAVVQGALEYALLYRDQVTSSITVTNHNLMARYGVLYRDPRSADTWRFKELLNPATRPVNENSPVHKAGMTIYSYDSDLYDADPQNNHNGNTVDLSGTPVGFFVQSYANDTAADMNIGSTEYITLMSKFHLGNIPASICKRVPISMVIDENNEMTTRIGKHTDDPKAPLRVDVDKSMTFRRSMWPFWDEPDGRQ